MPGARARRYTAVVLGAFVGGSMATVFWKPRARRWARIELLRLWTRQYPDVPYGPAPEQRMDVLYPRWPARGLRPVAVVIHGGGWREGSRSDTVDPVCRRYLQHGYTVFNIGYRCQGIVPASEDVRRALDEVHRTSRRYGGDPERIVVTGASAGGHLALLSAFTARFKVRAVVNFYGVSDPTRYPAITEDPSARGPDAATTLERLSPLTHVRGGLCPVLSIHGTADDVVDPSQTRRLTMQLLAAGVPATEMWIEGGRHGFGETDLARAYQAVFAFLGGVVPRP